MQFAFNSEINGYDLVVLFRDFVVRVTAMPVSGEFYRRVSCGVLSGESDIIIGIQAAYDGNARAGMRQ